MYTFFNAQVTLNNNLFLILQCAVACTKLMKSINLMILICSDNMQNKGKQVQEIGFNKEIYTEVREST